MILLHTNISDFLIKVSDLVVLHAVVQPYGTSAIPAAGHAPLPPFRHFLPSFRPFVRARSDVGPFISGSPTTPSKGGASSGANLVERTGVFNQAIVILDFPEVFFNFP